jgi:CarD family transcriptional regulator
LSRKLDDERVGLLDSKQFKDNPEQQSREKFFVNKPRNATCLLLVRFFGGDKVGFKVGQKVVYPNHGIGVIEQIEQKQIGAVALPFYTLRLAATNSLVLVPVSNAAEVGLRRPISSGECDVLFNALATDFATPPNDWKDRFKDFSEKMRTGDIFEVAEVLKHLNYLSHIKPLSFREQRMLERSRYLVISELAAVCRQSECRIEPRVDQALDQACARHDQRDMSKARAAVAAGSH